MEKDFISIEISELSSSVQLSLNELVVSNLDLSDLPPQSANSFPNLWKFNSIGLYAQYASIGLVYSTALTSKPFCFYVFHGVDNLCVNSLEIVIFPWSLKILFALVTDSFYPFGYRRWAYMILGWFGVLSLLLFVSMLSTSLSASNWLISLMMIHFFMMISDVPSDGLSVELGRLEPPDQRGTILATGQMIRFLFTMLGGAIQAFLLNGKPTSGPSCKVSWDQCWEWGLTVGQYYGVLFVCTSLLFIPILFFDEKQFYVNHINNQSPPPSSTLHHQQEGTNDLSAVLSPLPRHVLLPPSSIPSSSSLSTPRFSPLATSEHDSQPNEEEPESPSLPSPSQRYLLPLPSQSTLFPVPPPFSHFLSEIWSSLQSLTTFYLLVYVISTGGFTNFSSKVNGYIQYDLIELSNLQSGLDNILSYLVVASAIWLFKSYLMGLNWRWVFLGTTSLSSLLSLMWLLVYRDVSHLRTNGWFTIFIDIDETFVSGLAQILCSLSIIETAPQGLEATSYELIVSVGNSASRVSSILATQFLSLTQSTACPEIPSIPSNENNSTLCSFYPSDCVSATHECFSSTDGPSRYTTYTLSLLSLSMVVSVLFVSFLPRNKEECHEWKRRGEGLGSSSFRGVCSLALAVLMVGYGMLAAILLLRPQTSCLTFVGGHGC